MMIQVIYFVNYYFMCDINHHFVGLCTVLQLPRSVKCKRELSCPSTTFLGFRNGAGSPTSDNWLLDLTAAIPFH